MSALVPERISKKIQKKMALNERDAHKFIQCKGLRLNRRFRSVSIPVLVKISLACIYFPASESLSAIGLSSALIHDEIENIAARS